MKAKRYNRNQHALLKDGRFSIRKIYKYVPEEKGTINIDALMGFSQEQREFLDNVFYKAIECIDKNFRVEMGRFGVLESFLECDSKFQGEQFELRPSSVKRIRLRIRPSKELGMLLEEMRKDIEFV